MTAISTTLQKEQLPALIDLYTIDCNPCGLAQTFYLSPNTLNGTNISFGGQAYTAFPISGEGWETSTDGSPPQPMLRVSNITKVIQPYLSQYQGLVGAIVTRKLTFSSFLDTGATPDGNQYFGEQVYEIAQVSKHTKDMIEFKLQSILDLPRKKIPRQQVLRSVFPRAGLFRK